MALGAALGALSSMLGPGFSGIIQAAALSGVNSGYATWRKTDSMQLAGFGFFTGFASGAVTGGLLGGLGVDQGTLNFIGGTLGGALYSSYLSMPVNGLI